MHCIILQREINILFFLSISIFSHSFSLAHSKFICVCVVLLWWRLLREMHFSHARLRFFFVRCSIHKLEKWHLLTSKMAKCLPLGNFKTNIKTILCDSFFLIVFCVKFQHLFPISTKEIDFIHEHEHDLSSMKFSTGFTVFFGLRYDDSKNDCSLEYLYQGKLH